MTTTKCPSESELGVMSSTALKARETMLLDKLDAAQSDCPELVEQVQAEVIEVQQARLEAIRRERKASGLSDDMKKLVEILGDAKVRWNFDSGRDITKPCVICGAEDGPHGLVVIGTYTRRMGGGLMPGDPIERPMCARCQAATAA